ncbi:MAG: TonB-dependent receptor plug domain-containing protein, partial [Candidatus Binatia bacterium]
STTDQQGQSERKLQKPAPSLLDEVTVTATREEQTGFEVPNAVTVVDREQIERQTPETLPDLLRGETGVYIQQTTPGQGVPIVRGLIGSSVLMLVDGMRLNTAFFRSSPNQYFAFVDPYNVERIEIVRGASSTLYGSDAMGGVIQVFTPVPRFDTEEWQLHGRALGQFSSANLAGASRVSLEGGKRGIGMNGGFTYQGTDDLRGGGSTGTQKPSGFDVYAADWKFFLEHKAHDVLVNVQYLRQPQTPRFDELVAGFGQEEPGSSVFFFEPNDRLFLHGRYRWSQPLPFLDHLQFNVAFQEINDDRRNRAFGSPDVDRERNRSRLTGLTLQMTSHWREWMLLTYGGEIYLDEIDSTRKRRNLETGEKSVRQGRFADGSTLDSFAFYVQNEVHFHPRLTAILGGRFSYFDVDVAKADREVGVDLGIDDFTGNAGLIYRLTPAVHLVTNFGRGFRVPNIFDLSTLGPRPGNRFNIPSTDLGPEEVFTVDAGVKWKFTRFTGEFFAFYTDFNDKIDDLFTGQQTEDGREIVQSTNLNNVTLAGIEVGSRYRFSKRLELFNSVTFTWGEEEFRNGRTRPADRIPPINGRLGVFYQYSQRIWVESFVRFAAAQDRLSARDLTDPRIDPDGTAGWVTANFRVGWEVHDRLRVRLALENLWDESYREHGSGINAPGINAIISLETHF